MCTMEFIRSPAYPPGSIIVTTIESDVSNLDRKEINDEVSLFQVDNLITNNIMLIVRCRAVKSSTGRTICKELVSP